MNYKLIIETNALYIRTILKAVVLFVDEDKTRRLLRSTTKKGVAGKFFWIGSGMIRHKA